MNESTKPHHNELGIPLRAEDVRVLNDVQINYKGKLNIYTCRWCFGHIVTKDIDFGHTPFMIGCKVKEGCRGPMQSSMYRVFDATMAHSFEWFRPAQIEDSWSQWERDHWAQGGLFLREVAK